MKLTRRQRELYGYIRDHWVLTGKAPTYEMLRLLMGVKSRSTIHYMVKRLQRKGVVVQEEGKYRTLNTVDNTGQLPYIDHASHRGALYGEWQ